MVKRVNTQAGRIGKKPLKDQVALLLNGTYVGGQSLAVSLAEHGADVVIVYRQNHAGHAQETKRLVEAEGRRCLTIRSQLDDVRFPREVVRQAISRLGRLDIFIDYSSLSHRSRDEMSPSNGSMGLKRCQSSKPSRASVNFEILSAALDQMVNVEHTDT